MELAGVSSPDAPTRNRQQYSDSLRSTQSAHAGKPHPAAASASHHDLWRMRMAGLGDVPCYNTVGVTSDHATDACESARLRRALLAVVLLAGMPRWPPARATARAMPRPRSTDADKAAGCDPGRGRQGLASRRSPPATPAPAPLEARAESQVVAKTSGIAMAGARRGRPARAGRPGAGAPGCGSRAPAGGAERRAGAQARSQLHSARSSWPRSRWSAPTTSTSSSTTSTTRAR